jgi:serine phosphatase RsbU (regulator of sigma subunit)/FixJ family two-component response regulator
MLKPVILCVDDEKVVLDSLWDQITPVLGDEFICELCESGEEALSFIQELTERGEQLAVIISDQLMPAMRGDELLVKVHEILPKTVKILLTGQASFDAVKNAINKARLYRYIPKPWEEADFVLTVTEAARSYQQYLQLIEHNRILRSLNKATQEISGEIEFEQLRDRLLFNILENTGAESCYLVTNRAGKLVIEGSATKFEGKHKGFHEQVMGMEHKVLDNLVQLIGNSNLPDYRLFSPIAKNGKQLGYIYLENAIEHDNFTQNHLEVVQMLASQAAISIENARLYQSLENRTIELQAEKAKVEEMNEVIEQKNKDVLDSIYYAKRIQETVLPPAEKLHQYFEHAFVLYQPKDIVSGDFYWWSIQDDLIILAVCDCTGHGVPGAFMSMMGINMLNQVVNEYQVYDPAAILNYMDAQLKVALNKSAANFNIVAAADDGMDCCIITYDKKARMLSFSGARRPLYLERDEDILQIIGTKKSVAEITHEPIFFESIEIPIKHNDRIYLFSDGMVDQFGGNHFRKYTPKRLKDLILQYSPLNMEDKKMAIAAALKQWQGNHEQTDDMLMVGIQF